MTKSEFLGKRLQWFIAKQDKIEDAKARVIANAKVEDIQRRLENMCKWA